MDRRKSNLFVLSKKFACEPVRSYNEKIGASVRTEPDWGKLKMAAVNNDASSSPEPLALLVLV